MSGAPRRNSDEDSRRWVAPRLLVVEPGTEQHEQIKHRLDQVIKGTQPD